MYRIPHTIWNFYDNCYLIFIIQKKNKWSDKIICSCCSVNILRIHDSLLKHHYNWTWSKCNHHKLGHFPYVKKFLELIIFIWKWYKKIHSIQFYDYAKYTTELVVSFSVIHKKQVWIKKNLSMWSMKTYAHFIIHFEGKASGEKI